ncbi:MAG: hypothetical protein ACK5VV_02085 [Lysobacteraceae bacterium]|jgi:hypothetical protein|nr:hypothetical protein [Silanimonas sp.]
MNPDWRTRGQVHDRGIDDQPPWWRDLPELARYALKGPNAAVLVVLSGIAALQIVPVIGAFATLLLLVATPKHSLEVLRDSAHGHREPPRFAFDVADRAVFAFLAILLVFAVVHLALSIFLPGPAPMAWRWIMALGLPLAAMSLAIDERIARAVNPVFWVAVMVRIGMPYLAVAVFVWAGLMVGLSGAGWLDRVLPPFLGGMVSTAVALWTLFTAAHLCGRLVFQYRDALGFTPTGPEQPERLRLSRDHRLEDQVDALRAAGDAAGARRLLEDEMRERALGATLHRRYRELLRAERDHAGLLQHGAQWLHQKVVEGDVRGALSLAQECLDLDASFTALDPGDWPPLRAAAERAGMRRLAEAIEGARGRARPAQSGPSS